MTAPPKDPDRHKKAGVLGRPGVELRDEVQVILDANGWTMSDFIVACLVLLTKNPQAMLTRLDEFRPPRTRGRPPKRPDRPQE